jgi:Flp pilus assembly CpaE family ATPase
MNSDDSTKIGGVLVLTSNPLLMDLPDLLESTGLTVIAVRNLDEFESQRDIPQCNVAVLDSSIDGSTRTRIETHLARSQASGILWLMSSGAAGRASSTQGRIVEEYVSLPATAEVLLHLTNALLLRLGYRLPTLSERIIGVPKTRGQSIAVFSVKGGVGKSTVAMNLAVGLTRLPETRVLLVDADLAMGDMGVLLDVNSRHSLYDVCFRQITESESLMRIATTHSSGVSVMLRPPDLTMLENLNTGLVAQVLPTCAGLYDHVVVNMSSGLDELNLQILDQVDKILVVTTPEMPAIHNTHRFLEIARGIGYLSKTSLVMNRAESGVDMTSVEKTLRMPVAGRISSAGRVVVQAANDGTSLFISDPQLKHEVTRNFAELVEMVAGRRVQKAVKSIGPRQLFSRRVA